MIASLFLFDTAFQSSCMITGHMKGGSQGVRPVWLWKILPPCVSRGRMRVPSAVKEGRCSASSSYPCCHFGRRLAALIGVGCLVVFKVVVSFFAVLGLRGYVGFSLFAESRGYSLAVVCRLLIAVASPFVEHRLSSCRTQT